MPNIETILRDRVTLKVECIDRIYLNGYLPGLQRSGQLAYFFSVHRGKPVPSPALLKELTQRFGDSVKRFAARHHVPIVHFRPGERKDDVAKRRYSRFRHAEGVVFIGVAQEKTSSFRATPIYREDGSLRRFDFYRAQVCVNHYYFYIIDRDWGPGFIKFSSYAPFSVKVCINGHEWAKRQLQRLGIDYEALDNGFLSCAEPERLQSLCDELGPEDVDRYFRRWLRRLPHPLSRADRAAGYLYRLSVWQFEYSVTHVFDRPLAGRQFFEEVLRENLDLGRPDRIQLLFGRRVTRRTPSSFRTRVVQHGVLPKLSVQYKHSRVKQYLKEGRALRTETVINNPDDVGVRRLLHNLPHLRLVGRNVNQRLLTMERVSHNCIIGPQTLESVVLPRTKDDGTRVPALRFGEPRVMALLRALCLFLTTPNGFTNRSLREHVAALHNPGPRGFTPSRMTYDLRRLRLHGLIQRLEGQNRYVLTSRGRRVALFFSKAYARILRPIATRLDPTLPDDASDHLRNTWRRFEAAVDREIQEARLAA